MNYIRSATLLLLFIIVNTVPAAAQDNDMLPDIDPQDIEIRSEFQARFQGLRRQQILGFEPTATVDEADLYRIPYMEDLEDTAEDLTISNMLLPPSPILRAMRYSREIDAFAQ